MNREERQKVIEELREKFSRAKAIVITDYKGMDVAQMLEFRNLLRESAVEYRVVKNTLARIASEDTPMSIAKETFNGPVGIALGYDDPLPAAKGVLEFSKKNEQLKVTGGVVEGKFYALNELQAIAELPPKEILLGMLANAMVSPAQKMACALSATLSRFAYALNALKAKKETA